jgi:hypothetical protein
LEGLSYWEKAKEDVTMKLKWKQIFLTFAVLTVALAGCSSSDSTTPQETQSPQDTFRKYSGNLHDVEFRQALRNSWVGTSETSGLWAMSQDEQLDSTFDRGVPPELLDAGKKIGGGLIKKGLSYAIDKAFGIQTKAQKLQNEENFINKTLLGIQHQLTEIQNTLADVYSNQVVQMSDSAVQQLQVITDFSNAETLIIQASSSETDFQDNYTPFIKDIEDSTSAPKWEVDFKTLCDSSKSFISTYYNDLSTDGTDDENTILAYAYNVVNDLFGTSALAQSYVSTQAGNATTYIDNLIGTTTGEKPQPPATGINLVSNFYAAGTRVTQAAYGIANILQKAYFVMAFTLQLAAESECSFEGETLNTYLGKTPYATDIIYSGITFPITSGNLSGALSTLKSNFDQFVTNAQSDIDALAKPFLTYDGGKPLDYWNPVQVISHAGLNLADNFMQNGCFPFSYVKNVNGNGNLDYLAAECNYNDEWTVLQLYIPTKNGTEALNNIRYLNDPQDFGLIGDIDSNVIKSPVPASGTVASTGSTSDHYDTCCGTSTGTDFSDCWIMQSSIQLNYLSGAPAPLYGAGYIDSWGNFNGTFAAYNVPPTGLDLRYTFYYGAQGSGFNTSGTTKQEKVLATFEITPNGHVLQGTLDVTYTGKGVKPLRNFQVNFGVGAVLQSETRPTGPNIVAWNDNTQVSVTNSAVQNAAGQNGNVDPDWAENGFGISLLNAPQPDAKSYTLCANTEDTNTLINLNGFYSYNDGDEKYFGGGTITDAYTIKVNGYSGTFDTDYSSLTINNQKWTRATAKTTVDVGQNCMQGLWQSETGGNTVYMTTNCSYPMISGTVSKDNGDLYEGVTMTLASSSGGDTQSTKTDSLGNYVFMAKNGTYTVTPSSSGYVFSPTSTPVTVSTANVPGVDFTATSN